MSLILAFAIAGVAGAKPGDWPNYGHFVTRQAVAVDGPNTIDSNTLEWVASKDPQDPNYDVEFESATGPVVYNGKVYAYAKYFEPNDQSPTGFDYTHSQIVAYDANSGQMQWATVIDQSVAGWDSWPTPCVDTKHNTVLIGSGDKVFCLDAESGTQQWARQLDKIVINASVCTALDIPHARAFITDYDGFGSTGMLYCINLDVNEPGNAYEPGDIVWSDTIGATSGNSAAYKDGVVYVASIAGTSSSYGTIYAYDAAAVPDAVKLWETTDANFDGFSGGVTVTKEGFLYAANYDWADESEDNSILCKLDCNDGNVVWTTATERTNCIPVVVGDKIYIGGGLNGWGSRPKVTAYQDLGGSVTKLWETGTDMVAGGWSNQLTYANGKLYVGAIPLDGYYFGSYTDLYIFDVAYSPNEPQFIAGHYEGGGNSPAVTYDSVYTIGPNSLFKFHQEAFLGDVTKDGKVDMRDLFEFSGVWLYDGPVGVIRSDLDLDGDVDFIDFCILVEKWREKLS
jgi:outer membrane protein assembly factor BamB